MGRSGDRSAVEGIGDELVYAFFIKCQSECDQRLEHRAAIISTDVEIAIKSFRFQYHSDLSDEDMRSREVDVEIIERYWETTQKVPHATGHLCQCTESARCRCIHICKYDPREIKGVTA